VCVLLTLLTLLTLCGAREEEEHTINKKFVCAKGKRDPSLSSSKYWFYRGIDLLFWLRLKAKVRVS